MAHRPWLLAGLVGLAVTGGILGVGRVLSGDERAADLAGSAAPGARAPSSSAPTRSPAAGTVVVAVGDIACAATDPVGAGCRHADTAALAERLAPAAVLALGDLVYPGGDPNGFETAYAPTWGRLKARTRPAPGNHEYVDAGAGAYFRYWGAAAGPGWHSFDLAGWHVVSLNSNCATVGCGPTSAQGRWLRADLAAHPARCTIAFWHHARWSSGLHGSDRATQPLWEAVHAAGVDVVLVGHDHHYERFARLDGAGRPAASGPREFVVGTGGKSLYPVIRNPVGSEKRVATAYGVLALRLQPTAYSWEFIATDGRILDSGTTRCH